MEDFSEEEAIVTNNFIITNQNEHLIYGHADSRQLKHAST